MATYKQTYLVIGMKKDGYTLKQIAKEADLSQATVSKIIRENKEMLNEVKEKLEQAEEKVADTRKTKKENKARFIRKTALKNIAAVSIMTGDESSRSEEAAKTYPPNNSKERYRNSMHQIYKPEDDS